MTDSSSDKYRSTDNAIADRSDRRVADVIVVGAGHAGCEAALASARCGARTVLITLSTELAACMPCNPSIGGIAKSHLVFELDALGGEMGRNADYTGIHFRTLNTRRGPAVQSNRVQCDKDCYSARMAKILEMQPCLEVVAGEVSGIWMERDALGGVLLCDGSTIIGENVVLTPGTALRGRIHIGSKSHPGGGNGEGAADGLAESLKNLGFRMARLKTGTPPRLRRGSINYDCMSEQPGDRPPPMFSWGARRANEPFHVEHSQENGLAPPLFHVEQSSVLRPWQPGIDQMSCYLTNTTGVTHDIIRANLDRSSLYGGHIDGTGVRYCPSVEDKIVKFPDKTSHHVFIEPEGRTSDLIYPNGISNSLPEEVQIDLVHSIPGLEKAEIVSPGFAIEYDFCDPTQLLHSLESKRVNGLFMAGQTNGTTGYEEAAAQGFVAGVNAARRSMGKAPITFSRTEAYIGVLIDDLVTKGTDEPYRMFTSRAERRLLLRQDNARYRMMSLAGEIGVVDPDYLAETRLFDSMAEEEIVRLRAERDGNRTLEQALRRPGVSYTDLTGSRDDLHPELVRQIEIRVKYDGYIQREELEVAKAKRLEGMNIPASIDYTAIPALRLEAREKLERVRPVNIGQASRIPGISPADVGILSVWITRLT